MKKHNSLSPQHLTYVKKVKRENFLIIFLRIAILILALGLWELMADAKIIDSFITSSPSRIVKTIKELLVKNNLLHHIGVTLYETVLGL